MPSIGTKLYTKSLKCKWTLITQVTGYTRSGDLTAKVLRCDDDEYVKGDLVEVPKAQVGTTDEDYLYFQPIPARRRRW